MITVKPFLETYCEQRELPPPTQEDISSCGRLINYHFKHYWANKNYDNLIPDCGFLVVEERGLKMVVYAYPDIFKSEMANRIDLYFLQKNKSKKVAETVVVPLPETPPKKRKRIPAKPIKERSVKPSQKEGQIQGQ